MYKAHLKMVVVVIKTINNHGIFIVTAGNTFPMGQYIKYNLYFLLCGSSHNLYNV